MAVVADARSMAPERSMVQRMDALALANEIRGYRAELKRQMKRRQVGVREKLVDGDPRLGTMKVLDLLLAAPKVGRVKAMKVLGQAKVSPSKSLGGLSERQRREVVVLCGRQGIA